MVPAPIVVVDFVRILGLAGFFGAGLVGALYAGAHDLGSEPVARVSIVSVRPPEPPASAPLPDAPVPEGHEVSDEMAELLDAHAEVVDPETGVRLGALSFVPRAEEPEPEPAARPRPRRRTPPAPPVPRLHPDPGMHVILTARRMMQRGEAVRGSCYRYLAEVFTRAGHSSWRTRSVVYQGDRDGPYANLGLIRPGDWLYIVNHPDRTPVGTHSVLFVSWSDRSRGYANVIEHPGGGSATAGRNRTYDVSRTYRIVRPIVSR